LGGEEGAEVEVVGVAAGAAAVVCWWTQCQATQVCCAAVAGWWTR